MQKLQVPMSTPKQVAVLVETSRAYGRGILYGIRRFLESGASWSVLTQPRGLFDPPPRWLADWKGDGIIARVATRACAKAVMASGLPVVDVRLSYREMNFASVGCDNVAMTRMAFEHLASLGLRSFGFCGSPVGESYWSDFRCTHFCETAAAHGYATAVFPAESTVKHGWDWERRRLITWLRSLPKPIGIMTHNDDRGTEVLEACRDAGLRVPDDIAVIGVDNDELVCDFSRPGLTSIDPGAEGIGYEAAKLLDRMMKGKKPPSRTVILPPVRVVERESTRLVALDDTDLKQFVELLRGEAFSGKTIQELTRDARLSRSSLQRRFVEQFGHSPKEEVIRLRSEMAKKLLFETDQSIGEVSTACGFSHVKHLCRLFRMRVGMRPTDYRRLSRKKAPSPSSTIMNKKTVATPRDSKERRSLEG